MWCSVNIVIKNKIKFEEKTVINRAYMAAKNELRACKARGLVLVF